MELPNAIEQERTNETNDDVPPPSKTRSLSDPPSAPSSLQPSPNFHQELRRSSKDDYAIPTTPKTAGGRATLLNHGLSLQMPARDMSSLAHYERASPLSPHLDSNNIYSVVQSQSQAASPVTSLPRHSRGLDFSRASTNLHHSTLAESSPDLSPIITQKGVSIPPRKMSVSSMALDSPYIGPVNGWGLVPEKSAVSSSVGSVNMLASDSGSDSSEDDASMGYEENDDPILTTPQVHKLHNQSVTTPFANVTFNGPVWGGANPQSPAASSLIRTIRKSRLNKNSKRPKKSSSSASNSGYSSLASPRTTSPPPMKSIEGGCGYFGTKSRRESLALGTDSLHLSSGNDSGDEAGPSPSTPGVVRRPVTRRGNLLPKTKGFARIRAALQDEASPVDSESRREAETIRQVRERDTSDLDFPSVEPSSPAFLPAVQEDFTRDLDLEATPMSKGLGVNFQLHGNRNSAFWNREPSAATPPPNFPASFSRQSSTMNSEATMDSPIASTGTEAFNRMRGRAQSIASDMSDAMMVQNLQNQNTTMNDDMHLKKFKRRRDDDSDISTVKRRAVSPGMSSQNSPIMTQSPAASIWGLPPERKKEREITSASSENSMNSQFPGRSGSTGSVNTPLSGTHPAHGKKLGLQGMNDTNHGLMNMTIE